MRCTSCHGDGQVLKVKFLEVKGSPNDSAEVDWIECPTCHGSGSMPEPATEWFPMRAEVPSS